jgi:tRNA A-37 threonylcarbamoyl transferase component Bud32
MKVELQEVIGQGAFADVWRAKDELGRTVAVKVVRDSGKAISDAIKHATALARARHDNVVVVHYIENVSIPGTGEQTTGIVMELITGKTLFELITNKQLTVDLARHAGLSVIDGLEHLHTQGLAHGDLHAENVMIDGSRVKILDILYIDTLKAMKTGARDQELRHDFRGLLVLLQDMLEAVGASAEAIARFNTLLYRNESFDHIRDGFRLALTPSGALGHESQIESAYQRFVDEKAITSHVYADAVAESIDADIAPPLLLRIVRQGSVRREHKMLLRKVWQKLNGREQDAILSEIAATMEREVPEGHWVPHVRTIAYVDKNNWIRLPRINRLRIEAHMIQNVLAGRRTYYEKSSRGGDLATWIAIFGHMFEDRDRLIDNISFMLEAGWDKQNYIGTHFIPNPIVSIADTPARREKIVRALKAAVSNDAKVVVEHVSKLPDDWQKEVADAGDVGKE